MKQEQIREELNRIAAMTGGILFPKLVVDEARNPSNPLHEYFTWDNDEAAEKYRLSEARALIRVCVTVLPAETRDVTVRAFVSLSTDRKVGGGYRSIVDVLGEDDTYRQALADAFAELTAFQQKFSHLRELSDVMLVINRHLSERRDEQQTVASA